VRFENPRQFFLFLFHPDLKLLNAILELSPASIVLFLVSGQLLFQ